MVRPRNTLLAYFPAGTVSVDQASVALRLAGGDVEKARRALAIEIASGKKKRDTSTASQEGTKKQRSVEAEVSLLAPAPPAQQEPQQAAAARSEDSIVPAAAAAEQAQERLAPRSVAPVNNLSDRQYCCVWHVEVFDDGYRPQVARALLARVARHVNPILRERGWRVKRLMESASRTWIGLCTGNNRADADAASTNIQLNLRTQPSKFCKTFRSFPQVLSVMLHESESLFGANTGFAVHAQFLS